MDRQIVYTGAIPQDIDVLLTNKNTMTAIGMALQMILGTGTWVDGLNCTPTSPASLQVLVAQGSIVTFANMDGTAYGSIGSDTTHQIVKQGIVIGNTTFTITVPSTAGQSQKYLIQAEYQDQGTGSVVLPYYNASNPAVAYNGPANSGTSQNTIRKGACVLNLKAGTAATTGTEVTPTPDAGFTGLWVIDVANGATTIVSGNITRYPGAPFIDQKLNDKGTGSGVARTLATGNVNLYVATTGSDSNPGTSGSPFQTIQHAVNVLLSSIDGNGFTATVNIAAGTYTAGVVVNRPFVGFSSVQISGSATTAPANCVISTTSADCIEVINSAVLNVSGFKVTTTTGGNGLNASQQGYIVVNGFMEYGAVASGNSQIVATYGGEVDPDSSYTISGGGPSHWAAEAQGRIGLSSGSITVTITGSPTFGSFAQISDQAYIRAATATFSGGITGQQFSVTGNSLLSTAGTSGSFPGSGTTVNTGGQVI
jgi:hypothetical protein